MMGEPFISFISMASLVKLVDFHCDLGSAGRSSLQLGDSLAGVAAGICNMRSLSRLLSEYTAIYQIQHQSQVMCTFSFHDISTVGVFV